MVINYWSPIHGTRRYSCGLCWGLGVFFSVSLYVGIENICLVNFYYHYSMDMGEQLL